MREGSEGIRMRCSGCAWVARVRGGSGGRGRDHAGEIGETVVRDDKWVPLVSERGAAGLRLGCWTARVGWLAGFRPSWLVCPFFFVLFIFLFLFSVFRFSNLNFILF